MKSNGVAKSCSEMTGEGIAWKEMHRCAKEEDRTERQWNGEVTICGGMRGKGMARNCLDGQRLGMDENGMAKEQHRSVAIGMVWQRHGMARMSSALQSRGIARRGIGVSHNQIN